MSKDVLITPESGLVEFKTDTVLKAKIELDASNNLVISNPGGNLAIGDTSADVYIGNGIASVDIIYEQSGEIRALSGKTLTVGQSDSNVIIASPINGITTFNNQIFALGGLRIGTAPGDPNAYVITRTIPAGDPNSGSERTELLLFHSNDPNNGSGPDFITIRAPSIRLQTYNDATVSTPDASAGWNNRLVINEFGDVSISGNLTVNGTTTTINSTTVTIDDPIFTLGGDTAPTVDDNKDRGIEFRWHDGTAARVGFFGFDDSTGYLTFIPNATNSSEVFSGTAGDIQATNFRGALIGNADSSSVLAVTDDTTTNATYYPSFAIGTTGNQAHRVSSTKLTFNPSTGVLSSTDYNSTSDINLKKNVQTASGLDIVMKLRGVEFDFIENNKHSAGVIAQEVEEVIPHIVNNNGDHKTVSYQQIIAYLIEGMKEQQKQIDELKNMISKGI